ncbi:MAG: iron ABC transporter permease [Euryarchaeota archaeon]|nr:iron ABC transporter permease [Euryarchaeota archaeon]
MAKTTRRRGTRTGKKSAIQEEHGKRIGMKILLVLTLPVLIFIITGISATLGSADLTIWDAYSAILHKIFPEYFYTTWLSDICVWHLRLPRIAWAITAGFGLGISGAAMQAILRNPLASPFTLGISSGAAFGVSLAIVLNLGFFGGMWLIIGNAFIFAMLCSGLILGLASIRGATSEIMILCGIAMNYIFGAASSLFKYFASDQELREMSFWGMGDLGAFSWEELRIVMALIAIGSFVLMRKAWDLNVMTVGDETAKSLGVESNRIRAVVMTASSLLIAGIVAFTGIIGFVGLVGPHMARMVIGADHRFLLPASGLLGGVILLGADTVGRTILAPIILPVGSMTSMLGVPFFLYLILKRRREYW